MKITNARSWRTGMAAAAVLCLSSAAMAGGIEVKSVSLQHSSWELNVKVQDKQAVSNACDYYLQSFEYLSALKSVVVEMAQPEHCMSDVYGQRQGSFKWELPVELRLGAKFNLVVNGELMGSVHVSRSGVEFEGVPVPNPAPVFIGD